MARVLTYAPKDTWIHRLSGVTKMIFLRDQNGAFPQCRPVQHDHGAAFL